MVHDHLKANSHLKDLAAAANIPLSKAPDAEDQALREHLDRRREARSTGTTSAAKNPATLRTSDRIGAGCAAESFAT
jgi:hypothetical protein